MACHCDPYITRYKAILDNHIPPENKLRLLDEFNSWEERITCKQFWTEQRSQNALVEADSECSAAANNLLLQRSEALLVSTTTSASSSSSSSVHPTLSSSEATISSEPASAEPAPATNDEENLDPYLVDDTNVTAILDATKLTLTE